MTTTTGTRDISRALAVLLTPSPPLALDTLVGMQLQRMGKELLRAVRQPCAVRLGMRGGRQFLLMSNPETEDRIVMIEPNLMVRHVDITEVRELDARSSYRLRLLAGDKLVGTVTATDNTQGALPPLQLIELTDPRLPGAGPVLGNFSTYQEAGQA